MGNMYRARIIALALAAVALAWPAISDENVLDARDQWASWRGPLGTGVAPRGNPPRSAHS